MRVQQLWNKSAPELMSIIVGKKTLSKSYNHREIFLKIEDFKRFKPFNWIGYNVSLFFLIQLLDNKFANFCSRKYKYIF